MLKKKKSSVKKKFGFFLLLLCLGTGVFLYQKGILSVLAGLIFNKNIEIKKTNDNTLNLLVLGIGGGSHDGPNLSDTIMYAHINLDKKTVHLVSIPRDLWIPELSSKINNAYSYGEEKEKGKGILLVRAVAEKVIGQNIDYVTVLNFQGFITMVDLLGGIEVNVERTFDDFEYPDEGKREDLCGHSLEEATTLIASMSPTLVFPCRYQHVHFDQGSTQMDGEMALKFVRSRHAVGDEGTDFARSKRQLLVIQALRQKATTLGVLLNPVKLFQLYSTLEKNIITDIPQEEIDDFIKLAQKMKDSQISSFVIDTGDDVIGRTGLLSNPPISSEYKLQWVLIPSRGNGNFTEIHSYISCNIEPKSCVVPAANETNNTSSN